MASEDIFEENFSEEVIMELDKEYVDKPRVEHIEEDVNVEADNDTEEAEGSLENAAIINKAAVNRQDLIISKMASEDIFEEDFSEEVITQLDKEYVDKVRLEHIQEDANIEADNDTEETDGSPENAAIINKESHSKSDEKTQNELKLFQLPLTRVRNLMKLDPDLSLASNEAVFIVTRATELFIESLSQESYSYTTQSKKKTVQKRDVDLAVSAIDTLMFLDGAMNF